jgi:hypothetical protein
MRAGLFSLSAVPVLLDTGPLVAFVSQGVEGDRVGGTAPHSHGG